MLTLEKLPPVTPSTRRMCGDSRTTESLYLESGTSPQGNPVEDYLWDYPWRLPSERDFPLPKQGVKIVEVGSAWHVLDWVGEGFYPDPAAFVEEVRALGLSRKISPLTPNLDKLTPESQWWGVHAKAWVNEWELFRCPQCQGTGLMKPAVAGCKLCYRELQHPSGSRINAAQGGWRCPKQLLDHRPDKATGCCAGIWWENTSEKALLGQGVISHYGSADADGRYNLWLTLPCGARYQGRTPPPGLDRTYSPAIFMAIPLQQIAVVLGPQMNPDLHHPLLVAASRSHLPVQPVRE